MSKDSRKLSLENYNHTDCILLFRFHPLWFFFLMISIEICQEFELVFTILF